MEPTPNEAFTFSGWFSGQPNLGSGAYEVQVEGFTGASSTPGFTETFILPQSGWVNEDFTGDGAYNKFLISPLDSGGNPSPFLEGYIWMDNVQLTTVPDTGAGVVGTVALLGTVVLGRRKQTA